MNITKGTYTVCRQGYTDRAVIGLTQRGVLFYPAGQEKRPMETPTADFMAWCDLARAIRMPEHG
jgi:hypothetical protein